MMNLLRPHFRTTRFLERITTRTQIEASTNLAQNINPYAQRPDLAHYPQPQDPALVQAMAHAYGIAAANLIITHGGEDGIDKTIELFCEPNQDAILIHTPTFYGYHEFAKMHGARTLTCPLIRKNGQHILDEDAFIAMALNPDNKVTLAIICSPNNPTGDYYTHAQILKIARALEGKAALLIDEAYIEISGKPSFAQKLDQVSNVLILRTLSKAYGLTNLRTGALLFADQDVAHIFRQLPRMYPTTDEAARIATQALTPENQNALTAGCDLMLKERKKIAAALKAASFVTHINDSHTNFIFFASPDAQDFCRYLLENYTIFISGPGFTGTPDGMRVSIGKAADNQAFIKAVQSF